MEKSNLLNQKFGKLTVLDEFVTLCNLVSENNKKEELLAGGACEIK